MLNILHATVLLCAAHGPCTLTQNQGVIQVPGAFAMPGQCNTEAQTHFAGTVFARNMEGRRIQILCERVKRFVVQE